MMKKIGKLFLFIASLVIASIPIAGCTRPVGENVDPTKTQLYVFNHYAGLKDEWLQAVVDRFVKAYENTSFEEGKTGVQIFVDNTQKTGDMFINEGSLPTNSNEVFFTENVAYYDFIARNQLLDITDVVTEKLEDCDTERDIFGEDKSIEDKLAGMNNGSKEFYKTDDGKYYALPFYEAYSALVYDIDLFEDKSFYFAKGGCPSEFSEFTQTHNADKKASGSFTTYKYVGAMGERSAGPDGLYGTDDDGLPATYDEFFVLCENISGKGVRPMVFFGDSDYLNETATALYTDYEGKDKMSVNFTFEGKGLDIVTGFEGGKPVSTPTDVTPETGYLIYQQEGRYYALDFLRRLIKGEYYDSNTFATTQDQKNTQSDFLYGRFSDAKRTIAMMAEGSWWQNEARDHYENLVGEYGESASLMNRRIGMMALPKATEAKIGEPQTYLSTKQTGCFINKSIAANKVKLAKEFVKFCHTDESLVEFMQIVNMPKPFAFDMTDEQLEKCSTFGRDLYKAHSSGNVVFSGSKNAIFRSAYMRFMSVNQWDTKLSNGLDHRMVSTAFKNNPDFTAKDYFDGLKTVHSAAKWAEDYGKYFE